MAEARVQRRLAASDLFREAVARDDNFAPAHAAYAQCDIRNRLLGTEKIHNYNRPGGPHARLLSIGTSYDDPPVKVKERPPV